MSTGLSHLLERVVRSGIALAAIYSVLFIAAVVVAVRGRERNDRDTISEEE